MAARKSPASKRVLAVNVTVVDDAGVGATYMAGTEVSDEVAALIDNPTVWSSADAEPEADAADDDA